MHFIRGLRHRRLALAAIAIFAVAGGVAYAAIPDAGTGVYHACMLKNIGTIRIIDAERQRCSSSLEVEITFNKQGPTGNPGPTGPTGTPGQDGQDGEDGQDGAPFSGTFTSPNGAYSLSITDTGIVLSAPASSVTLTSAGLTLRSQKDITLQSDLGLFAQAGSGVSIKGGQVAVQSDRNLTFQSGLGLFARAVGDVSIDGAGSTSSIGITSTGVGVQSDNQLTLDIGSSFIAQAGTTVAIESGSSASVQAGGALSLKGSHVSVNPGASCSPAARIGDAIAGSAAPTGAVSGTIASGSGAVCVG